MPIDYPNTNTVTFDAILYLQGKMYEVKGIRAKIEAHTLSMTCNFDYTLPTDTMGTIVVSGGKTIVLTKL